MPHPVEPLESNAELSFGQTLRHHWQLVWPWLQLAAAYQFLIFTLMIAGILWQQNGPTYNWGALTAWDAHHYMHLAESGYTTTGDPANYIAFFPFYPLLVWITHHFFGSFVVAGLVVSSVFSIIGHGLLLALLKKRGYSPSAVQTTFWLLAISPTAVYFTSLYTESVFLGLTVFFFYCLEYRWFKLAALIGCFASMTRTTGVTLIFPFVWQVFSDPSTRWRISLYLRAGVIGLGFALYLGLNWFYYGSPFHYQTVLKDHWSKVVVNPLPQYRASFASIPGRVVKTLDFFESGLVTYDLVDFVMVACVPWVMGLYLLSKPHRVEWGWLGWTSAQWLIVTSQSFLVSSGRYILIIFPLYVFIAQIGERWWWSKYLFGIVTVPFFFWGFYNYGRGWWLY